jgi:DNA-binding IclR family transcriptional regulator
MVGLDSGTEAAARVADVLRAFAGSPSPTCGISEIARATNLSKGVVHRIVQALCARGVLAPAQHRRYRLGALGAAIGARAFRECDLRAVGLPYLRQLHALTGETVTLSALVGYQRCYLDQIPSTQEIRITTEVGGFLPLHVGASGKAILAFAPRDVYAHTMRSPLASMTPKTPTDPCVLERRLEAIRRDRIAESFGERISSAGSIAAPLIGVDGLAVGAISLLGLVDRFDAAMVARCRPLVRDVAERISRAIGAAAI